MLYFVPGNNLPSEITICILVLKILFVIYQLGMVGMSCGFAIFTLIQPQMLPFMGSLLPFLPTQYLWEIKEISWLLMSHLILLIAQSWMYLNLLGSFMLATGYTFVTSIICLCGY